jgi:hypothetical protein
MPHCGGVGGETKPLSFLFAMPHALCGIIDSIDPMT